MWLYRSRSFAQLGLRRTSRRTNVLCLHPSGFLRMATTAATPPSGDGLVRFEVLSAPSDNDSRLGKLDFPGRNSIQTPHYAAIGSRGTVPHITQDLMLEQSSISAMYTALEDYVEKLPKPIPMLSFPCAAEESPLRRFIALQGDPLLILGPRRLPPVAASTFNSATHLNVFTSVGFVRMEMTACIDAVKRARPDIAVGVPEIEFGKPLPSVKRIDKMDERTLAWIRGLQMELSSYQQSTGHHLTSLWPPLLPVSPHLQRSYMEYLEEQPASAFGGVALYANDSLPIIPSHLRKLPRLLLNNPKTPQDILTSVSLGADLLTAPFVTSTSEAGQAFTFKFPVEGSSSRLPLVTDLWSADHATSFEPLVPGCPCYTCGSHHRAYIHHLLQAKEMLAWVLLQLHNHAMFDAFFAGIRQSLAAGTFDRDVEAFEKAYDSEFPAVQGDGPRIRGYQMASAGPGEEPRNKKRYRHLTNPKPEKKIQVQPESAAKLEVSENAGLFASAESQGDPSFDRMYEEVDGPGSGQDEDVEDRKS